MYNAPLSTQRLFGLSTEDPDPSIGHHGVWGLKTWLSEGTKLIGSLWVVELEEGVSVSCLENHLNVGPRSETTPVYVDSEPSC